MTDTVLEPSSLAAPAQAPAAVGAPPPLEAPAVQPATTAAATTAAPEPTGSEWKPRWGADDLKLLMGSNEETQRAFMSQLLPEELSRLDAAKGDVSVLFSKEAAATDPASQAPAPEATDPASAAPATGTAADADALLMTPEEYAAADPKTKALFDAYIDLAEKVPSAPAEDPLKNDPIIAWRREQISKGNLDIPAAPSFEDLGGVELLRKLDEAYQNPDPNVWIAAQKELIQTISQEVIARGDAMLPQKMSDAYTLGETRAEFRSELKQFVRDLPDFKGESKPLFVRSQDGDLRVNREHPVEPFMKWLDAKARAGVITDAMAREYGWGPIWGMFQADKAGGYEKLQAANRQQAFKSVAQRMADIRAKASAIGRAPSVSSVQGGATSSQRVIGPTFHGVDLNAFISNPQLQQQTIDRWANEKNHAALNGWQSEVQKLAQVNRV